MDSITSGTLDIYAELGVEPTATTREINKQFRILALKYHPDKNHSPEAPEKFHLISLIHSVLSDALLRQQYDRVRQNARKVSAVVDQTAQDQILRFRDQLVAQEIKERNRTHTVAPDVRLEKLRLEGLAHRRNFHKARQPVDGYVLFRSIPNKGPITDFSGASDTPLVTVQWKLRSEPGAQIDDSLLQELMSVFGPVVTGSVLSGDGRYGTGTVSFATDAGARLAVAHDYRKSASLWDGRNVRKLASLLRSCKWGPCAACWEDEYAEKLFEDTPKEDRCIDGTREHD